MSKARGASVLATTGEVGTGLSQRQRLLARLRDSGVPARQRPPEAQLVAIRPEAEPPPEPPPEPLAEQPVAEPVARPVDKAPAPHWDQTRIAVVQKVWGKGFIAPGGKQTLVELAGPLDLRRGMNVLDLGAGLGGPARVLAKRFGARVIGLEADRRLADAGSALSSRIFLPSKASVRSLARRHEVLAPGAFDRIFSKDVLFAVRDKARLLAVAEALLAEGGRMLLVDYVVAADGRETPAVRAWMAADPARPAPWSVEDYIETLTGLGLNLRIDDISGETRKAIKGAWSDFLTRRRPPSLDRRAAQLLLDEARLWSRRAKLLKTGELRACRILAER